MRLWIDTDVGTNPDDGVALLAALALPGVEVVGVSTVSGDAGVRAAVARVYVTDPGIPVIAAAGEPRPGGPPPRWLGHEGDGPIAAISAPGSSRALAEVVAETAPDALLAIGPLTNVAALIEAGAAPARIVAMAGVTRPVWHRGELRTSDHNTVSDPAAAAVVRHRAVELLSVPLDVTVAMRLDDRDAAVLAAAHPRLDHEVAAWLTMADAVVLHDPLALLAAVGEAGITVAEDPNDPRHRRVVGIDPPRLVRRILDLVVTKPR